MTTDRREDAINHILGKLDAAMAQSAAASAASFVGCQDADLVELATEYNAAMHAHYRVVDRGRFAVALRNAMTADGTLSPDFDPPTLGPGDVLESILND